MEISLRKNPKNCETIRNETSVFEQEPIKLDGFNEIEEKDVKELVVKRKQKQREVAESNKLLKKKEEVKEKERAMMKRRSFNKEFRDIKAFKKESKKFQKQNLRRK